MPSDLPRRQFLKAVGANGVYLLGGGYALLRPRAAQRDQADALSRITQLASDSAIASYHWVDPGKAPAGYIKGMAVSYAKVCYDLGLKNTYAVEMAKAMTADASKDAFKYYEKTFHRAQMDNSRAGQDTLRHLFVLMLGLGMSESSGNYCDGRDPSAENTDADTAEAGLFQTSFNARSASPLLPKLFNQFMIRPVPNYRDVFKEGVHCRDGQLRDYGTGRGRDFQKLSKDCPFFAVAFAGVGLRNVRDHWGTINRHEIEVKADADTLFRDVQSLVEKENLGPLL